jgi:protein SCO1/2
MPTAALAHDPIFHSDEIMAQVAFDQRLDETLPSGLAFVDDQSQPVRLGDYLGDKPMVLAMTYFECETLCPLVRGGLAESLAAVAFTPGAEFDVVVVSIDPGEGPEQAAAAKADTIARYGRPESAAGWHFLTGDHAAIDELAEAIGFRYAYDGERDEYAHPSGVVVVTPGGKIARYFYGIEYGANDLRLGLVEAGENRIGNPVDRLLLLCYHYDPRVGQYNLAIMNGLRVVAALTVVGLGSMIFWMRRQETNPAAPMGRG